MKRSSNSTTKGSIRQSILMLMIALFGFSYEGMAQMNCVCAADKKTGKMACTCTDKNAKAKEVTQAKVVATQPKAVATQAKAVAKKTDVPCAKPVAIAKKHKAVKRKRSSTAVAFKPAAALNTGSFAAQAPAPCENACWGYRKNNIFVTICPGLMFDRQDRLVVGSDRSWSGYRNPRPTDRIDTLHRLVPVLVAPQRNVIDNYDEVVAPVSGNFPTPEMDYKIKSDGDGDFKIKSDDRKIKSDDYYRIKIKD